LLVTETAILRAALLAVGTRLRTSRRLLPPARNLDEHRRQSQARIPSAPARPSALRRGVRAAQRTTSHDRDANQKFVAAGGTETPARARKRLPPSHRSFRRDPFQRSRGPMLLTLRATSRSSVTVCSPCELLVRWGCPNFRQKANQWFADPQRASPPGDRNIPGEAPSPGPIPTQEGT
jgi:hypothetical protein